MAFGCRADAERVVREIAAEVGLSFNLEDQIAIIAYNHKEYADALAIWERVLPQWKSDQQTDMQPVFGLRSAAICASRLALWGQAASLYGQAELRGSKFGRRPWYIGLQADRGHALWMAQDYSAALEAFGSVVEELQTLPNKPESLSEFAVQKLVGHTLSALASPGGVADYVPGMCSEPSPSKNIGQLPSIPQVFTWYFVHVLATKVGDKQRASFFAEKLKKVPFAFLRAMAALDDCKRVIESDNLDDVARFSTIFAVEMAMAKKRDDVPVYVPDPEQLNVKLTEEAFSAFARPGLWTGLLRAKAIGHSPLGLIKLWWSMADPQHTVLRDELDRVAVYAGMSAEDIGRIMKDPTEPSDRRMWAVLFLIGNDDASLVDTAYAHTTLVSTAKNYPILRDVGGLSADALIRKDWQRFRRATFLLRSPRLYLDAIQAASEAASTGWSSAARIVLAWNPATALRVPRETLEALKSIVNEQPTH
jgi:hypothetical protein